MSPPSPQLSPDQARRNRRLALIHVVLALASLAGFVWITVAQRG
ncbi:MAG: hypothetical protein Q8Q73_07120 [Stagnimonas sp.]|nr:hypothetical protein [Stagnimonas sp.]